MKIARLYYKRDEANELDRFYIKRVSGSKTIGIAICHDDSQYDYLKANIQSCWHLATEFKARQYTAYKDGKLSLIASTKSAIGQPATSEALDSIYEYLRNYVCFGRGIDVPDLSRIEDVIRASCSWYISPQGLVTCIGTRWNGGGYRDPVDTIDGFTTLFYQEAGSNSYWNGDEVSGENISQMLYNDMRCCEDCDYVEYGEDDSSFMYIEGGDYSVCEACYDDNYTSCCSCSNAHHYDNMRYHDNGDSYYCDNCYPQDDANIHGYDYTPPLNFYDYKGNRIVRVDNPSDVNLPFYGTELEVECMGGSKGELADIISNFGGGYEKFAYCKRDGSLSNGFEVCFMPMTFHAIKDFKFYDAVLKYRGRDSLQSYNTSTCGMHIHINREAFTDHHLFKYISFIHEFKSLVYLISQRKKVGEFNSYAKFNNSFKDRAKRSMVESIKSKKRVLDDSGTPTKPKLHSTAYFGDKYVPINLQHNNTIEVRIFKGNLLEVSFRKNFEFVDALYYFTRENPIYKLKAKEFVNYCTNDKKRYPNLNKFLANNTDKLQDILRFPLAVPEGLNY